MAEDVLRGGVQPAERGERMAVGAGEEPLGFGRVVKPAPHEHLGEHVRDAERGGQPLGGAVVVRHDGEVRVDPRGTVAAA